MPISDFSLGCEIDLKQEISMVKYILMQVGASETEGRNRGAKPRGEMKSNGSCVLWLFATLVAHDVHDDTHLSSARHCI